MGWVGVGLNADACGVLLSHAMRTAINKRRGPSCRIRWLSRSACVARVKSTYAALLKFFKGEQATSKGRLIYEWLT